MPCERFLLRGAAQLQKWAHKHILLVVLRLAVTILRASTQRAHTSSDSAANSPGVNTKSLVAGGCTSKDQDQHELAAVGLRKLGLATFSTERAKSSAV
mmetsp:Transcript_1255/g.2999  ORF Transcript_1255/g.2999 Transcript_1255/m.2999 type:complete len:98 (+) Transcript_1255:95-388(+)